MTTLTRGAVTERPGRPHYQHERALMLMPPPKLAEVFWTAAGSSSISPTTSALRSRDVLLVPLRPSRLPELTRLEDYHRQVSDDHHDTVVFELDRVVNARPSPRFTTDVCVLNSLAPSHLCETPEAATTNRSARRR